MISGVAIYIHYSAQNADTNLVEIDDAANHTLKLVIDGVVSTPTNSPENIAAGECRILLTAAESVGAKIIAVAGVSSTPDVYIIPAIVITDLLISATAFVIYYTAWDVANNAPKTGDAANHTLTAAQDGTSGGIINTPAEIDAVNIPGLYKVAVTSVEATGKVFSIVGVSATADINVISTEFILSIATLAESDVRLGIDYNDATLTGTAAIPGPDDVRSGVPVDDTIGNYVPADPTKHALGDQYGSLGTEFIGTKALTSFQLPEEIVVEDSEIIIYEEAS